MCWFESRLQEKWQLEGSRAQPQILKTKAGLDSCLGIWRKCQIATAAVHCLASSSQPWGIPNEVLLLSLVEPFGSQRLAVQAADGEGGTSVFPSMKRFIHSTFPT